MQRNQYCWAFRHDMRFLRSATLAAVVVITVLSAETASADPVPRTAPAAGSVIAVKMGEEINFVETANWRDVENRQDVLPGDVLRANDLGERRARRHRLHECGIRFSCGLLLCALGHRISF
jgi:hypothetical protein